MTRVNIFLDENIQERLAYNKTVFDNKHSPIAS